MRRQTQPTKVIKFTVADNHLLECFPALPDEAFEKLRLRVTKEDPLCVQWGWPDHDSRTQGLNPGGTAKLGCLVGTSMTRARPVRLSTEWRWRVVDQYGNELTPDLASAKDKLLFQSPWTPQLPHRCRTRTDGGQPAACRSGPRWRRPRRTTSRSRRTT